MNSSLSPTSMLLFEHTYHSMVLIKHAEKVAKQIRNGATEYDFLAFEVYKDLDYVGQRPRRHPDVVRIKKTLQRDAQRKRLKAAPIPHLRSQRSMCFVRARAWLEVYNYPFFHKPDGTIVRRWIDEDGKERVGSRWGTLDACLPNIGAGSAVVGYKKKPRAKIKDPFRYYEELLRYIPEEQPELECMEQWRMGLPKPPMGDPKEPTPVAFEHHAVHGKQPLLRKRGNSHATLQRVSNKQK